MFSLRGGISVEYYVHVMNIIISAGIVFLITLFVVGMLKCTIPSTFRQHISICTLHVAFVLMSSRLQTSVINREIDI